MAKTPFAPRNPAYQDFKPDFTSQHVYFYYLKHDPEDYVEAYYIPIGVRVKPDILKLMIPDFLESIKGKNPPRPVGPRLGSFVWRQRSYFVVVLEDRDEKLIEKEAVTFSVGDVESNNKTFRGGQDVATGLSNITAFFCRNDMKKKDGEFSQTKKESENIKIVVNHNKTGVLGHDNIRAHTDTGTNTGPPQE